MDITELKVCDGHLECFLSAQDGVKAVFVDWQDNRWSLNFKNVLALEALSPEGEDIAELTISQDDDWIGEISETLEEEAGNSKSYCFISAWSNLCVLKLIADSVSVTPLD